MNPTGAVARKSRFLFSLVPAIILLLGTLFILATITVFGGIAMLAGRYSEQINQSKSHRKILNRSVSIIFLLLGLNLFVGFI